MFVRDAKAQTEAPPAGVSPDLTQAPSTETHEAVVVEEHGSEGGFAPLETEFFASQLLWLAITFGLLYFVISRVIAPRIGGILENRHDRIALDIDAAERMRLDADEAQAAYEQELATARERSHRIAQEARETARANADAERKTNEAALDAKLETAQGRIAEIKAQALADVDAIAEETTEAILAELAGLHVSRDEVSSAIRAVRA